MNIEQHTAKAQRVLSSLAKLHFPEDYLALIDGAVVAGYHLGNALLHKHGVSDSALHFNSPSKLEVPISGLPAAIQPAFKAFAELERLRFEYVRNPSCYEPAVADLVKRNLDAMKRTNHI
ncbi:MAG: hypothetical protein AABZ67_02085 [Pseudomonadota bacterium]